MCVASQRGLLKRLLIRAASIEGSLMPVPRHDVSTSDLRDLANAMYGEYGRRVN